MIKSLKKISFLLTLIVLTNIITPTSILNQASASAEVMDEKYLQNEPKVALDDIKKNKNIQITVVGNLDVSEDIERYLSVKSIKNLKDIGSIKAEKQINTIILDSAMSQECLNKSKLKDFSPCLNDGQSLILFIPNTTDMINKFYSQTRNGEYYEQVETVLPLDNAELKNTLQANSKDMLDYEVGYVWLTKSKDGEYIKGINYVNKATTIKERVKSAVVTAWHRQSDHNIKSVFSSKETNKQLKAKSISLFGTSVYAVDYVSGLLNIGNAWRQWGWTQLNFEAGGMTNAEKTFPGGLMGPSPTPHVIGKLTVWQQWADLKTTNGQIYVACIKKNVFMPQSGFQTWGAYVGGDVDYCVGEGYTNKLFDCAPMTQPGSSNYTYSVGGGLSGVVKGFEPAIQGSINIGYSTTRNYSDIYVSDLSDWVDQNHNCWIGYRDYYAIDGDYCKQTTRQDCITIAQVKAINGKTKIPVKTLAYFYEIGTGGSNAYSCGYYWIYTLTGGW
jgi:hypothetical protein